MSQVKEYNIMNDFIYENNKFEEKLIVFKNDLKRLINYLTDSLNVTQNDDTEELVNYLKFIVNYIRFLDYNQLKKNDDNFHYLKISDEFIEFKFKKVKTIEELSYEKVDCERHIESRLTIYQNLKKFLISKKEKIMEYDEDYEQYECIYDPAIHYVQVFDIEDDLIKINPNKIEEHCQKVKVY